jgi:hypothetical protein
VEYLHVTTPWGKPYSTLQLAPLQCGNCRCPGHAIHTIIPFSGMLVTLFRYLEGPWPWGTLRLFPCSHILSSCFLLGAQTMPFAIILSYDIFVVLVVNSLTAMVLHRGPLFYELLWCEKSPRSHYPSLAFDSYKNCYWLQLSCCYSQFKRSL